MDTEVFRIDLLARRRAVVGYALGMAVYALVIVAIYPEFEHSTSLNNITKNTPALAALFGAIGSLTSPSGWLNVNLYANVFPLLVLLVTVGYGASCLAGQDEDGTLGLIATLPIRRRRIVAQKALAMVVQAAVIVVVVAACVGIGRIFHVTVSPNHLIGASAGVLLLGIDLGLVALAVGAASGSRGVAIGVATAVAAASYLVSSLAPVVNWVHPARFVSLFYWSVGNNQLTVGLSAGEVAVLVVVGVVLGGLAMAAFDRLDLH
jgi:ABC-2 type transport system permease protein